MKRIAVVLCLMSLALGLTWAGGIDDDSRPAPDKAKVVAPTKSSDNEDNSDYAPAKGNDDVEGSDYAPARGNDGPKSGEATEVIEVSLPTRSNTKYVSPASSRPDPDPEVSEQRRGGSPGQGLDAAHRRGSGGWQRPPRPRHPRGYNWRPDWRRGHRPGHWRGYWGLHVITGPIFLPYPVPVSYPRNPHRKARGVYVDFTGDDIIGSNLNYAIREYLRDYDLIPVYSREQASLELYIVSSDIDRNQPGSVSSIAVSYIWFPGERFITTQMMRVSAGQIDNRAESIADYADQLIEEYR